MGIIDTVGQEEWDYLSLLRSLVYVCEVLDRPVFPGLQRIHWDSPVNCLFIMDLLHPSIKTVILSVHFGVDHAIQSTEEWGRNWVDAMARLAEKAPNVTELRFFEYLSDEYMSEGTPPFEAYLNGILITLESPLGANLQRLTTTYDNGHAILRKAASTSSG